LLAHPGEGVVELGADGVDLLGRGSDVGVCALHGALDHIDGDIWLLAAGTFHPSDAEEVRVGAAVAFGVDEAHA